MARDGDFDLGKFVAQNVHRFQLADPSPGQQEIARLFVATDGAGAFDYLYSPGRAGLAKSFDRVVRSIDCPQHEGHSLLHERYT